MKMLKECSMETDVECAVRGYLLASTSAASLPWPVDRVKVLRTSVNKADFFPIVFSQTPPQKSCTDSLKWWYSPSRNSKNSIISQIHSVFRTIEEGKCSPELKEFTDLYFLSSETGGKKLLDKFPFRKIRPEMMNDFFHIITAEDPLSLHYIHHMGCMKAFVFSGKHRLIFSDTFMKKCFPVSKPENFWRVPFDFLSGNTDFHENPSKSASFFAAFLSGNISKMTAIAKKLEYNSSVENRLFNSVLFFIGKSTDMTMKEISWAISYENDPEKKNFLMKIQRFFSRSFKISENDILNYQLEKSFNSVFSEMIRRRLYGTVIRYRPKINYEHYRTLASQLNCRFGGKWAAYQRKYPHDPEFLKSVEAIKCQTHSLNNNLSSQITKTVKPTQKKSGKKSWESEFATLIQKNTHPFRYIALLKNILNKQWLELIGEYFLIRGRMNPLYYDTAREAFILSGNPERAIYAFEECSANQSINYNKTLTRWRDSFVRNNLRHLGLKFQAKLLLRQLAPKIAVTGSNQLTRPMVWIRHIKWLHKNKFLSQLSSALTQIKGYSDAELRYYTNGLTQKDSEKNSVWYLKNIKNLSKKDSFYYNTLLTQAFPFSPYLVNTQCALATKKEQIPAGAPFSPENIPFSQFKYFVKMVDIFYANAYGVSGDQRIIQCMDNILKHF